MSFFEATPDLPPDDHLVPPLQPWFEPPRDVMAALVPDRRILARQGPVALLLSHIDAYPSGCRIHLVIIAHRTQDTDEDDWWDLRDLMFGPHRHRRARRGTLPDDLLRFGVQYADGSKATTSAMPPIPHHDSPPEGPVLQDHGGGGGGGDRHITMNRPLWLWPLPPLEPFDLVFEWPAAGISERQVQLDGTAITRASERCEPLFPSG